ncbi:hypothetical protein AC1031_017278 [Aphanomyces cochlioides]|nr:hypothetical protein AC1031_017278 [Aphanomyces cochlioides]
MHERTAPPQVIQSTTGRSTAHETPTVKIAKLEECVATKENEEHEALKCLLTQDTIQRGQKRPAAEYHTQSPKQQKCWLRAKKKADIVSVVNILTKLLPLQPRLSSFTSYQGNQRNWSMQHKKCNDNGETTTTPRWTMWRTSPPKAGSQAPSGVFSSHVVVSHGVHRGIFNGHVLIAVTDGACEPAFGGLVLLACIHIVHREVFSSHVVVTVSHGVHRGIVKRFKFPVNAERRRRSTASLSIHQSQSDDRFGMIQARSLDAVTDGNPIDVVHAPPILKDDLFKVKLGDTTTDGLPGPKDQADWQLVGMKRGGARYIFLAVSASYAELVKEKRSEEQVVQPGPSR